MRLCSDTCRPDQAQRSSHKIHCAWICRNIVAVAPWSGLLVALATLLPSVAHAEPSPGDLFREYTYTNTYGDAGGSIRVGGKLGVSYPDRGSDSDYINAWVDFPHKLDLEHAMRAEVVVEKILSHNGTTGLAIQWNDAEWIPLPPPAKIPKPQADYYHHTCITQNVPLDALKSDKSNRFRLRVNPEQPWKWPQHLIYGVHLRIYYDSKEKKHAKGSVVVPTDQAIRVNGVLRVELAANNRRVDRVDYLGKYEGVNWPGDGAYDRWQYFYYHGKLKHHIGSSTTQPFSVNWETSWIPDQARPIQLAARIIDDTGLIYMTPSISDLKLHRPGLTVELCKPEDVPDNWVTRNKEYQQSLTINDNLSSITAARLCWSSWSPGYMNGLFVNGQKVLDAEGPNYRYFDHRVAIDDLSILKQGKNIVSTGKTPLHDGKMVHGMEVNWPGIQLLIQREEATNLSAAALAKDTATFFRVEQRDHKWHLLDPSGKPFVMRGLNHDGDGSGMPWNRQAKFGSPEQWRKSVRDRVQQWGFNYLPPSIGPTAIDPSTVRDPKARLVKRTKEWPAEHFAELKFPFTIFLEYPKQYMAGPGMPDVFSEKFAKEVDARCREVCQPLRDNPHLIGYHLCHNPPWHPRTKSFDQWINDATKPGSEGRKEWVRLMRRIYGSLARWRATYGIPVESWEEIETLEKPLRGYVSQRRHLADREAFMQRICERWYKTYHDAIRRYDKNHLILGDRNTLHLQPLPSFAIRMMSKYVDVLSVNVMGPPPIVYEVLEDATRHWDGPIHLADTGAGIYNGEVAKAGFTAANLNEFEKVYSGLITMARDHPQIIGFGWCGFYETPAPSNRSGLVDVRTGDPISDRLQIMKRWNAKF